MCIFQLCRYSSLANFTNQQAVGEKYQRQHKSDSFEPSGAPRTAKIANLALSGVTRNLRDVILKPSGVTRNLRDDVLKDSG